MTILQMPRRHARTLAIVTLAGVVLSATVLRPAHDQPASRLLVTVLAVSCWYLLYLGLWYFFEDARAPVRVGHWVAFVATLGTTGVAYMVLPLRRLFRAQGEQGGDRAQQRPTPRWLMLVCNASARVQGVLLLIAALAIVVSGMVPVTHVLWPWVTRYWTLPFAGAFLLWMLSLPLFIIRAIREDDVAPLWCGALVLAPIMASIVYEVRHR